ncbi:MAG: hydroxyacid dehydrogenase [Candidatus Liptonbacteria bacterium]|nr:hydroxyacid dehydrogenase [Candidatus Liptonbacteria bacterium]
MKTQFFTIKPWEKDYLETKIKELNLPIEAEYFEDHLDKDHLPSDKSAEIISVFVGSQIDKPVLDAFPNLKLLTTRSTGYDHIDVSAAKAKNLPVAYVPGYGENTVAEFAFGLILALSRKIYLSVDQIRESGSFNLDRLQGFDLKGKTLGVVGTGHIGKHMIRMAKGFDMNVVACDAFPDQEFQEAVGFEYLSLEDLLKRSDIVTLHVPYMKETHHLVNATTIQLMKKGAYLINTARGAIVETEALVQALKNGDLAGAGLDVLEEEGIIDDELDFIVGGHPEEHNLKTVLADHVLIDMPGVIVTPHNAFNTREALERILATTLESIRSFLSGTPKNLIE